MQPQIIWGSYVRIVPLPPQLRLGGNLVKKIDKTRKILALIHRKDHQLVIFQNNYSHLIPKYIALYGTLPPFLDPQFPNMVHVSTLCIKQKLIIAVIFHCRSCKPKAAQRYGVLPCVLPPQKWSKMDSCVILWPYLTNNDRVKIP